MQHPRTERATREKIRPKVTDRLRPHHVESAPSRQALAICRGLAALLLLLPLAPAAGRAAEPAPPRRAPSFSIETGAHSRDLQSLATDAAGRYLLTGAADASARLWDAASGRLLQVLRPPLADHEASVDAVALSRSGGTAAIALRAAGPEPSTRIYLFDRAGGRVLRRTGPVPATVRRLAFSGDGDRLAAALDRGGTALFEVPSAERRAADLACATETAGADFDATGRLAVSCADGAVRLYDPSLRLQAEAWPEPGAVPAAVRFSPDGSRIALAYSDRPAISLLSARDLSLLSRPDTAGIEATELHAVTWSPDGTVLCAGGARGSGQSQIRCWDAAAPGWHAHAPPLRTWLRTATDAMIAMAGVDLPMRAARAQIASAIGVIIQANRLSDGTRKITSIQEVTGIEGETLTLQEIFQFRQRKNTILSPVKCSLRQQLCRDVRSLLGKAIGQRHFTDLID